VNETDENGFTPVFYATKFSKPDFFNILVNEYHADITVKNNLGQTPLMYVEANCGLLKNNVYISTLRILERILNRRRSNKMNISDPTSVNTNTDNENCNIKDKEKISPKSSGDIDNNNNHPIIDMKKNKDNDDCKLNSLKQKNENVDSLKSDCLNQKDEDIDNLISDSLKQRDYSKLKNILKENENIDINKYYNGRTIMSTIINNNVNDEELFDLIIKRNGYIENVYILNTKPRLNLLIEKNTGLIKSIIRHGLIVKKSNSSVKTIKTPLIQFIKSGHTGIVKKLLENNANVNETDEKGFTPIFYA